MSIVVRHTAVGVTAANYDEIHNGVKNSAAWPPDGLDHHICFGTDGDLHVSEVWDSREQFEAWGAHLMPILVAAGVEFAGPPEVFEVHNAERR
jgi:hypothetical protein